MRGSVWGLIAAIVCGAAFAESPAADVRVWRAKPELSLAKFGVSYWRLTDAWADPDAVITIDADTINYSGACDSASFSYKQHWESEGQLEVAPAVSHGGHCPNSPTQSFLRFYFAFRQANAVKSADDTMAITWSGAPLAHLKRTDPDKLEDRRWIIVKYRDENALADLTAPNRQYPDPLFPNGPPSSVPPLKVIFGSGVLQGSAGCGRWSGDYRLTAPSLLIHAGTDWTG